ncbi:uncharacterized protein LOC122387694 [Amphibalanus amphitrite]|uniref:uncharacterized protein LOC122387694 n=1 Tax=Amphibalanus amphitrite TaxID=1232801 RepID=UPI001C91CAEF|nr:uncharacterized protein LOC122387694 [Amphibalanus amphitrite]
MATCDCNTKALRLSPEDFTGNDLVELRVRGASRVCLRVTVKRNTFYHSSVKRVTMQVLNKVMLVSNSIRTKPQRQLTIGFENIEELVLKSHSFSGPVDVTFTNTSMSVPDKAFVDSKSSTVMIINSTLVRVSGHAFSSSRLLRLELRGCAVRQLQPSALRLQLGSLVIQRCSIGSLAADALAVRWTDSVRINGNTFESVPEGAFGALRPMDGTARLELHDNQLLEVEPGGLALNAQLTPEQLSVQQLHTRQLCRCQLGDWVRLAAGSGAPDWLVHRLTAALLCLPAADADMELDTSFLRFLGRQCRPDDHHQPPPPPPPPLGWRRYLVGVAVAAALITVLCAVSCFAVWRHTRRLRERQRGRAAQAALHHRPHKLNNANLYADEPGGGDGGWAEPPESPRRPFVVAVPDVKTYTETELHVVLETLGSLEPTVLPRTPSGTLHRLRDRDGPRATAAAANAQSQEPGCRKSCPL